MRIVLELLRIILVFGLLGGFLWVLVKDMYTWNIVTIQYQWLAGIGIYIILFILYRNVWQFRGWYTKFRRFFFNG
ncbi:hypothetical protein [Halobacillus sp. A5]|uniref:hypothetical protein n=1 Tax=Halobacillus sp. A5 TaxID=2880263 RepID=UPI0020A64032|nr:hypothetical protein [Halobacillus sp. A5]MCP3028911.1 hypothetical protein [Halobacillus sp. A5]